MADVIGMVIDGVLQNWMLLLLIVTSVFAVLPYLALLALNFFNGNIINEIKATVRRDTVKVFRVLQNGQSVILYRSMTKERKILLKENENGVNEYISPTTAPHPDASSHRQVYVSVEGQEGTKNLLADSRYDVNSPQKTMAFAMAFEDGRLFEKALNDESHQMDLLKLALGAAPAILLFIVLIMVWQNFSMLSEIVVKLGIGA